MALSMDVIPAMLGLSWWDVYDYPSRISGQNFATGLLESDLHPLSVKEGCSVRERTQGVMNVSGHSCVRNKADEFAIVLQAHDFRDGEIKVRVVNNWIVVHGKHASREDERGFVEREFTRRYMLPGGIKPQDINPTMNEHHVVTIEVTKDTVTKEIARSLEYEVPITTLNNP